MTVQTTFKCEVQEVFSGDDLIAMVDLGVDNLFKKQRIRLAGVDTPQAISKDFDTEPGKIRNFVRQMTRRKKASLTVVSKNQNSWVVTLVVDGIEGQPAINVNDVLISRGYEFKR